MGRACGSALARRCPPGNTELAKKALGIRPTQPRGADARPRAGRLASGQRGAARLAQQGRIDWTATLLQGRPRAVSELVFRQRCSASHELWLVIVDASASTRRHQALSDAKGLLAQVFDDAYHQRARLALLTASGATPHWHVQGLKAAKGLSGWLQALGAGGGTPLFAALEEAARWLALRQKHCPEEQQRLLVVTDGRLKEWPRLPRLNCPGLLVDIERGPIRLGRARQLAHDLDAEYRHIDTL